MLLRELPIALEFAMSFVAGAKCVGRSTPSPFIFFPGQVDAPAGEGRSSLCGCAGAELTLSTESLGVGGA
jgi:hypothetical protein